MLNVPDEIKELLHRDSCKKNIRIHFPNGERTDICNDLIVMDSVKFTESLCSQNELKFGLCESPIFECEVVGVGNIKGASIEVTCEIYCPSTVSGAVYRPDLNDYVYSIPYGTFTVQEAKRQADMNHRRIQAYAEYFGELDKSPYEAVRLRSVYKTAQNYNIDIFKWLVSCIGNINTDGWEKTEIEADRMFYPTGANRDIFNGNVRFWGRDHEWFYSLWLLMDFHSIPEDSSMDYLYEIKNYDPISRDEILAAIIDTIRDEAGEYIYDEDIDEMIDDLEKSWDDVHFDRYLMTHVSTGGSGDSVSGGAEIKTDSKLWMPFFGPISIYMAMGNSILVSLYKEYGGTASSVPLRRISMINSPTTFNRLYNADFPSFYMKEKFLLLNPGGTFPYMVQSLFADDPYNIINSAFELTGYMGGIDREKNFNLYNLNKHFTLTPESDLYPSNNLHPQGATGGRLLPQDYQSCWYEDEYTKPYGAITCKYKNTSNVDCEFIMYLQGFTSGTDINTYKTYVLDDNKLIRDYLWTEAQIQTFCEAIAAQIADVKYMPVEFVGRGLPYVEAGDTFEILTASNDSITTIVLNRTISGEQVLTDTYKSV